jgi:hypothetical protein
MRSLANKEPTLYQRPAYLEIHFESGDLLRGDLKKLRDQHSKYNELRGHTHTRYVSTRNTSILRRVLASVKDAPGKYKRCVIVRRRGGHHVILYPNTVEEVLRAYAKAERADRRHCDDCGARHRSKALYGARCPVCDLRHKELIDEYRRGEQAARMVEQLWPAIRSWIER